MKKQVLALMDSEESYALRFMEHINRKRTSPFEVHAFTSREKLREYAMTHRIEILLISEHDMEEGTDFPANQIVVLTDHSDAGGLYPSVCKYQASSAVMREVMEAYGRRIETNEPKSDAIIKPPMRIAGVFSPIARCGKTSFSLALGQCLARSRATLYLNFEIASGLKRLLRGTWERDLSDVIYFLRRGDRNITAHLLPLIRELGAMGYVPPCASPSEIYGVEADEWRRLFVSLRRDSAYEMLVLDLGELPMFLPEILEECDIIYMPTRDDEVARAKLAEFDDTARERDVDCAARVRHVQIPIARYAQSGDRWAERLPYGALGKCAEEWIRRDRL